LLAALEREANRRKSRNRLTSYAPYPKQIEFHAAGRTKRERLLLAGNQLGKTLAAGAEVAMHLTGRYPDWWQGRVFDSPVHFWASGVTGESTRDNPQRILYGPLAMPGTGMIPHDAIIDSAPRRGLADALDTMQVRWGGGGDVQAGISQINFKSNDQGREKWQGPTLHGVWMDEEHDEDVYNEARTRTNVHMGLVMTTFTPLKGMTNVVKRFLLDNVPDAHVTKMTIEDALHYTPAQRELVISGYAKHERDARAKGIPIMGSGRVFPIDEDEIKCAPFAIPSHWPQLGGLDFGWDHPSAAVRMAWDRDADVLYVIAAHRQREQTPAMFAASVKPWGAQPNGSQWLPWAWPHDGLQHDKGSGEQLAAQYRAQGLQMMPMRATFEDGSNGLEAGVLEMSDRMQTGRLKVFAHLGDWFEEFNLYHRKDGLIVKKSDDLLSATRYAMMMRRNAVLQNKSATNNQTPRMPARGNAWMS
jgi:phage terminase large subunit-like protein